MRGKTLPNYLLSSIMVFIIIGLFPASGYTSLNISNCRIEENRVTLTLEAEPYSVINEPEGQRLKMENYGNINTPGQPALPVKKFLVALPPGTRAESIEILNSQMEELPGVYRIAPAPPIAMLPGMPRWDEAMHRMHREWEAEVNAVYQSGKAFPAQIAWLAGHGTLRKYSYATVAFCPFTYHPQFGKLEHHTEVEIVIHCEPVDGVLDSRLMPDTVADEKASRLFSNYTQIENLYNPGNVPSAPIRETYNYVVITSANLLDSFTASDFPSWKTSLGYSLRTVLITDIEITSQPGVDLAEQIRNFLRAYYAIWSIEYVFFIGDYALVPMRICYPDPDYHVYNPNDPGLVAPGTPTDYYYADLSYTDAMSWDSDGDGYHGEYSQDTPDFLAEVSVGRVPVNNPTRITYTLNKLVAFEQDTGDWKNNVLQAGTILFFENQNFSGCPLVDGATCLDSIETALMNECNITHFSEQSGLVTSLFDWPAVSEAVFTDSWGNGEHAVVNWSGHGWPNGAYRTIWAWDDGDGVPESGNGEMQSYRFIGHGSSNLDDDHPSIIFAISCDVGYPDPNPYGNLGIDLLTLPDWGPSAGIVSAARPAAVSGDWKNEPGGTEQICYDFNRYLLVEQERIGDALYDGKFYATTHYGWDRIYEYMNLYNFNLFGDPSLDIDRSIASAYNTGISRHDLAHLLPGAPNPFIKSTTMLFNLDKTNRAIISVHDPSGRRIKTLVDGMTSSGRHAITWDGRDALGNPVAPGAYFIKLNIDGFSQTQRVIRLR